MKSENLKFRKFGVRKFGFKKILRQDLLYLVEELLLQDLVLLVGRFQVELRKKG